MIAKELSSKVSQCIIVERMWIYEQTQRNIVVMTVIVEKERIGRAIK